MDCCTTLCSWITDGVCFWLYGTSISLKGAGSCSRCRYAALIGIDESGGRTRSETWIFLQEWLLKLVTVVIFLNDMVCKEEAAYVATVQSLLALLLTLRYRIGIPGSPWPLLDLWSRLWRALVVVFAWNSDNQGRSFLSWRRHRWALFMKEVLIWLGSDAWELFDGHFLRLNWRYSRFRWAGALA